MSLLDKIKFGKPLFDEVCLNAKNEYSVEQSISGYVKLNSLRNKTWKKFFQRGCFPC